MQKILPLVRETAQLKKIQTAMFRPASAGKGNRDEYA
jgi:hypothetical protein